VCGLVGKNGPDCNCHAEETLTNVERMKGCTIVDIKHIDDGWGTVVYQQLRTPDASLLHLKITLNDRSQSPDCRAVVEITAQDYAAAQ
jgi:aspartate carbamoyltransferase regulatory subunit